MSIMNPKRYVLSFIFFFDDTPTPEIYTLSLHDALPIYFANAITMPRTRGPDRPRPRNSSTSRSEEHTSELQSPDHLVCRLLLEKKKRSAPRIIRPSRQRSSPSVSDR